MLVWPFETHVPSPFLPLMVSHNYKTVAGVMPIASQSQAVATKNTQRSLRTLLLRQSSQKDRSRSLTWDAQRCSVGDCDVSIKMTGKPESKKQNKGRQDGSVRKGAATHPDNPSLLHMVEEEI